MTLTFYWENEDGKIVPHRYACPAFNLKSTGSYSLSLTLYRDRLKILYVAARSLFLLYCSALPCLGPA